MDTTLAKHIEATPGVCGGKPRIAGTRIRVQDIYICHELHGMSPDEIVDAYPHITLADVHAALAYYYDHSETIQQAIETDRALVESFKKHFASTPANPSDDRPDHGDIVSS